MVCSTLDVEETVIIVFVANNAVVGELVMIDPDLCRLFDVNQVGTLWRSAHLQVADNDIADLDESESSTDEA